MMLSGAFGAAAGLVVLAEFPKMGLWLLALLLGIDFLAHGLAWLRFAFFPAGQRWKQSGMATRLTSGTESAPS